MSWYSAGSVAVTNGSATIIGTGTSWVRNVREGDAFKGPDKVFYEVSEIVSDTEITLATVYDGATASGASYTITPTTSHDKDLVEGINSILKKADKESYAYGSRADLVAAQAKGGFAVGAVAHAGGVSYRYDGASSAISDLPGWVPEGRITVLHFGAVSYMAQSQAETGVDSAPAFQAALDYTETILDGTVFVPRGRYRWNSTVTATGGSAGFVGDGYLATNIVVTHTAGEALRFTNDGPIWRDILMISRGARAALAYDVTMPGIRIELPDEPFAGTTRTRLVDFTNGHVTQQPGSGVYAVGPVTGRFANGSYSSNKGHGMHFAEEIIARTNTADVPGLCEITTNQINYNGGHAICFGGPAEYSSPAVRVGIVNNEIGGNATDSAVRKYPSELYLRGAQIHVARNVLKPGTGNTTIEGWLVSGVGVEILNNRYINCLRAGTITSHSTLPTRSVVVDGMHMLTGPGAYDPLVLVRKETGAIAPYGIRVDNWSGGTLTRLVATDATMSSKGPEGISGLAQSIPMLLALRSNVVVNNSTTGLYLESICPLIAANETVHFELTVAVQGTSNADARIIINGPAGSDVRYAPMDSIKVASNDAITPQSVVTGGTTLVFGTGSPTSPRFITIKGRCANGATEGRLLVTGAQLAAEASDTTFLAGLTTMTVSRAAR